MHLVTCLYPLKSNGFIDTEGVFKLIVGTLKLCTIAEYDDFLEEVQPYQIGLLHENHLEEEKKHYEMISYATRVAYVSAMQGKDIPLFKEKHTAPSTNKVTKEQKQSELQALDEIFNT